jgi:hypothetical protein
MGNQERTIQRHWRLDRAQLLDVKATETM